MSTTIPKRSDWVFDDRIPYDGNPLKKETWIKNYISYYLSKTQAMFKYDGLPDTIPQVELEKQLQTKGYACICKVNDKLYALDGELGGMFNEYYEPTLCIVSNPYLNFYKTLKIGEDCIIVRNDSYYNSLMPLLIKGSTMLAEIDISKMMAVINTRIQLLLKAGTDAEKKAAEKFVEDIVNGKLSVIASNAFMDSIVPTEIQNTGTANAIKALIELEQYTKSSLLTELGINSSFNMKREALNSAETSLNIDACIPYVEDMLTERKTGFTQVNSMFSTDIKVELNSVWEHNEEQLNDTAEEEVVEETVEEKPKFSDIFKKKKKEVDTNED